jgi:hypothetical protein
MSCSCDFNTEKSRASFASAFCRKQKWPWSFLVSRGQCKINQKRDSMKHLGSMQQKCQTFVRQPTLERGKLRCRISGMAELSVSPTKRGYRWQTSWMSITVQKNARNERSKEAYLCRLHRSGARSRSAKMTIRGNNNKVLLLQTMCDVVRRYDYLRTAQFQVNPLPLETHLASTLGRRCETNTSCELLICHIDNVWR